MKFLFIWIIVFVSFVHNLRLKQNDDNLVLKLTQSYYDKIGSSHIDEFRNMVFRELDNKEVEKSKSNNSSFLMPNKTHAKKSGLKHQDERKIHENFHLYTGEYLAANRTIKFYISHTQECSVFVNDTISYENINSANFVEHMILHNNADNIDPKGVYSDDVNINFFAFNKKMNIFTVYFDPAQKGNNSNFSIEYDYDAVNLLKSNIADNKNDAYNATLNYNSFVWKILNQNFFRSKQRINIEVNFDLGNEFKHEEVEFSLNFTKSIIDNDKRSIVKYVWQGELDPQDVLVLQTKFPLHFDSCGNTTVNFIMICIGSVFIIFLIGMLYIILTTVFFEDT